MHRVTKITFFASLFLLVVGQDPANVTVPESDTRLTYSGTWSDAATDGSNCGRAATNSASSVSLKFNGTALQIYGTFSASTGAVSTVILDNQQLGVVDGPSCDQLIFERRGLNDGEHTVQLILTNAPTRPISGGFLRFSRFVFQEGNSTSPASSPHKPLSKGAIIAIAVGGTGAVGLSAIGFIGWDHIGYLFGSLLLSWFGWFIGRRRRLIFKASGALTSTQISLFLTNKSVLADSTERDRERPVVWQVFQIGGVHKEFAVDVPCGPGTGNVILGFATIDDRDSVIQCQDAEKAPARLTEDNTWEYEADGKDSKKRPRLVVRNTGGVPVSIALGTYHEKDTGVTVQPAFLIKDLPNGERYETDGDFYVHAFRTNNYKAGQYGESVVEKFVGDRLTPPQGVKLSDLGQLSSWYIEPAGGDNLKLKVGPPNRKDVKQYKHQFEMKSPV